MSTVCSVYVVKGTSVYLNGYKWHADTWCDFVDPAYPRLVLIGTVLNFYKFVFGAIEVWVVAVQNCPVERYDNGLPVIDPTVLTEVYTLEYTCLKYICHLANHWATPSLKCVILLRAGSVVPQ